MTHKRFIKLLMGYGVSAQKARNYAADVETSKEMREKLKIEPEFGYRNRYKKFRALLRRYYRFSTICHSEMRLSALRYAMAAYENQCLREDMSLDKVMRTPIENLVMTYDDYFGPYRRKHK